MDSAKANSLAIDELNADEVVPLGLTDARSGYSNSAAWPHHERYIVIAQKGIKAIQVAEFSCADLPKDVARYLAESLARMINKAAS